MGRALVLMGATSCLTPPATFDTSSATSTSSGGGGDASSASITSTTSTTSTASTATGGEQPGPPLRFAKRFGNADDQELGDLLMDSPDTALIVGTWGGPVDFDDGQGAATECPGTRHAFLAKLDSDGNVIFRRCFGENASARAVAVDAMNGQIAVIGDFRGTIEGFTPPVITSDSGSSDVFVARFSSAGAPLDIRRLGGPLDDEGTGIAAWSGKLFVAGVFRGTADLGAGTYTAVEGGDVFWSKFEGTASTTVLKGGGSNPTVDLTWHGGKSYLSGSFEQTLNTSAGARTATQRDGFLVVLDAAGVATSIDALGGAGDDRVDAYVQTGKYVMLGGAFAQELDFEPASPIPGTVIAADPPDGFVVTLDVTDFGLLDQQGIGAGRVGAQTVTALASEAETVVAGGVFSGAIDLGKGEWVTPVGHDGFVVERAVVGGAVAWALHIGQDGDQAVVAVGHRNGRTFVGGTHDAAFTVGASPGKFDVACAGERDVFVLALDD